MKVRRRAVGARRGVLLLIILALLAMFGLVAVAFVVVTGHAMRSSRAIQRMGQFDTQPQQTIHRAFLQVVRGTDNWESALKDQCLLEDLYGNDTVEGAVPAGGDATPVCGGQIIEFTAKVDQPHRRVGCVLTMLDGPAAGRSTRIVGYIPNTNTGIGRFQVLAFDGVRTDALLAYLINRPCRYVINGTPFSGAGAGYNPYSGKLDVRYTEPGGWPLALLPRPFFSAAEYDTWLNDVWKPGPDRTPNTADDRLQPPPAVANEDYDAVDFQNMLLAAQILDPETGRVTTIPSLLRPALVQYWGPKLATARLYRKVILRPHPIDHPGFTGSNNKFNPAWDGRFVDENPKDGICDYAWDVDNDGDTVPDGIWVDLGMPVRSMADGRLYKPLFSILCLDLDGRLNLNAHGCYAQTQAGHPGDYNNYYAPEVQAGAYADGSNNVVASGFAARDLAGQFRARLPRGQGYGPAEINLMPLFTESPNAAVLYRQLLIGGGNLLGRYGEFAGDPVNNPLIPRPGASGEDPLSYNKHFDYPLDYSNFSLATAYGTLPDLKGTLALGLDVRGQPLYPRPLPPGATVQADQTVLLRDRAVHSPAENPYTKASVDDPYELDLSRQRPRGGSGSAVVDGPFGISEWERLQRPFDRDAGLLPKRLADLTNPDPANASSASVLYRRRREVATESWDLPCPNIAVPSKLLDKVRQDLRDPNLSLAVKRELLDLLVVRHVVDLLAVKVYQELRTAGTAIDAAVKQVPGRVQALGGVLFSPEMLAGLKLDLNRPFGDGRDNPPYNGVVDEPGEPGEQLTLFSRPGGTTTVPFSYDAHGNPRNNPWADRQLHARQLYVLMMLLADTDYLKTQFNNDAGLVAHFLAQWAVNVVDFRDRDSIMTPFPYDPKPFDGWNPDGTLIHTVWGCERPELLITETLAFHDRRTEDLETPGKKVGPEDDDDKEYDQRVRPEGSLFIELYNPWTDLEPSSAVDLTRTAGRSPVWRLVIALPTAEEVDEVNPDDPNPANRPQIERSIYFRAPSESEDLGDDGQRYYPDPQKRPPMAPVLAGRYAVIGPGDGPGPNSTHMGFKTSGQDEPSARRIVLTPSGDPQQQQVAVISDGKVNDLLSQPIQPAVAVVINPPPIVAGRPRRLSVSEPTTGYDPYETEQGYEPVRDLPLDEDEPGFEAVMVDGTTPRFRVVYLQRLANPLMQYDQQTNPYRTIDSMQIDLTAFNSLKKSDDPPEPGVTAGQYNFFTRERGEREEQQQPNSRTYNLWVHEHPNPPTEPPKSTNPRPGPIEDRFREAFGHTLGYLNEGFQPLYTPTGPLDPYVGSPRIAFPWLNWNNRPFISQLELLLVPTTEQFELLHQYGLSQTSPQPYQSSARDKVPFPHLLNFFHSGPSGVDPPNSPQFHRLLEYVHVPSRFVGTELQGNPTVFAGTSGHAFHPPFNRISSYREPGRINLNTIFSEEVWKGLMNFFPNMDATAAAGWKSAEFGRTRQGYDASNPLQINPAYPTRFAGVFRSFAGGQMVPPIRAPASLKPTREINATLLRQEDARVAGASGGNSRPPLFGYEHAAVAPNVYPNDTDRNPYFRYQGLQRLGNLVTTRSNVYAIWITVGYFEVRPWPQGIDLAHPDGYQLGQELGIETGEVKRHRAFYVFDRSIPVGFSRGKDYNVEDAVLLRRFIE